MNRLPFLRLSLFFIAGVVMQSLVDVPPAACWLLGILSAAGIGLSFMPYLKRRYEWRWLFGASLGVGLLTLAVCLTGREQRASVLPDTMTDQQLYHGQLQDEPVRRPKTWRCKVWLPAEQKTVSIYLPIDSLSNRLAAGDCIAFRSELEQAPDYLRRQLVAGTGFVRKGEWQFDAGTTSPTSIRIEALKWRRYLLEQLRPILPDADSYALAAALMFGYRGDLSADLQQSFRSIGASHILAISGTHFAIVFGMLYFLLSFLGNYPRSRRTKQLIVLPLLWLFAFLTGFSPSVVRAAVMLTIWGVGEGLGYRAMTLNTVAVAAFFMLLLHPLYLFDVGFQLSFLAVISILLVNPWLVRLYESRNPILNYFWGLMCVSLSAQIGVLPLSIYYFHQFPVYFLLTNVCLLPLTALLLGMIPLTMLLFALSGGWLALAWPLQQLLRLFLSLTQDLSALPCGHITLPDLTAWETLGWYAVLMGATLFGIRKRAVYGLYSLLLAIIILLWRIL